MVENEIFEAELAASGFTAGENSQLPDGLSAEIDPAIAAEIFLEHRANSVKEAIASTVAFSEGVVAFKDDRLKLQEFLERLAKAKVLSSEEVAAGLAAKSNSFVSKLNKIQAYGSVILDKRVFCLLNPGYSVLYELALLYEALEGKGEENDSPFEILVDMMQKHEGPISRDWLKQERAKLKPPRVDAPSIVPEPDTPVVADEFGAPESEQVTQADYELTETSVDDMESESGPPALDDSYGTKIVLGEERDPIVAVFMMADSESVSRFAEAVAGDRSPVCVKIGEQIADRAALIVHGRMSVLLSMAQVVQRYGFTTCDGLYLLDQPSVPNVVDQMAMAVYLRGGMQLDGSIADWAGGDDPLELAGILLKGVSGRRVHAFADSHTFEWESIVGNENWQIE